MNIATRRPNILLLMADQLTVNALPFHGNAVAQLPTLAALAARSAVFETAYCNFPICAPSRYSMLAGRLPHAIDAFDNACEMPSEIPTMAHYLGAAGYRTILAGKMHFVGPDQLHGFDERLTTDIYPADFLWVPDWSQGAANKPTGVGMGHVVDAGPCVRNMQIDYDEEVEHVAVQKLYDLARQPERPPFFMTVSFTHPHPPFVAPQEHWDRYDPAAIDMPAVAEIPYEQLDPHSQWLYLAHGQDRHAITPERVHRARHAYYAMASYVDEKIGRVLHALERSGMAEDTLVVFCADHGEMLGERGMWFKQTFYEGSARVPLTMAWPGRIEPARVAGVCSLVDLLPTFLEVAADGPGGVCVDPVEPLDGRSLLGAARGAVSLGEGEAISEYSSEGVCAPSRMLRRGRYKYVYTLGLPPMLFDLEQDPLERSDLAGTAEMVDIERALRERLLQDWDPEAVNERILRSQRRRLFLKAESQRKGFPAWTFEAREGDDGRFVRPSTHGGAVGAKPRARFPFVQPTPPEFPGQIPRKG